MGICVGIDLGTSYSKIAFVNDSGHPTIIDNIEGAHMTPSAIYLETADDVIVGSTVKEIASIDPKNTILDIKSLIGQFDFVINCNGCNYTTEELLACLIKKLVDDASNSLGTNIKEAIFTVPTYFGYTECNTIKKAAKIAGVNALGILTDTSATALAYGYGFGNDECTILIYDLGGGCFDVSVMKICEGKFENIYTGGSARLGGKDWDDEIIRFLIDAFRSETGVDDDFNEYELQELRLKAEKAKQNLSTRCETPVVLLAAGLHTRICISRDIFNEITRHLLDETIEITETAIAVAKSKGYTIDEILLVGGSTRMPQVTAALGKFGLKVKIFEPDMAIAKGAAIYHSFFRNKLTMPIYEFTNDYAIRITAKGKNIDYNITVKDWKLSEFFLVATRTVKLGGYNEELVDFTIYEYIDAESYNTPDCINKNEYIKLTEFAFDTSECINLDVIQIDLTLDYKGQIHICCKNLINGMELTKFKFEAISKLKITK